MKSSKLGWAVVLAAVAVGAAARAELVDRVAAVVNEQIITLSEVEQRAAPELAQANAEPNPEKRGKLRQTAIKQSLDTLIGERLMEQQIKELNIDVSDAELEAGMENVREQNKLTAEQFEEALSREGYTLQGYKDYMRKHLAQMKLLDAKVRSKVKLSDQDLRAEYARWSRLESEDVELHARHILIQLPANASPEQVAKAKAKAEAIAAEARKPGVNFAELAKKRGESSSSNDGGELGYFKRGVMVPEFERVAFALKEGEVSDPVRTGFGFHVIKVEERRAVPVAPFDEVKEQMRDRLMRAQLEKYSDKYVQELRAAAVVDVKI